MERREAQQMQQMERMVLHLPLELLVLMEQARKVQAQLELSLELGCCLVKHLRVEQIVDPTAAQENRLHHRRE